MRRKAKSDGADDDDDDDDGGGDDDALDDDDDVAAGGGGDDDALKRVADAQRDLGQRRLHWVQHLEMQCLAAHL